MAQSFWLEVLLTLLLVSVILNVATQHRLIGANAALPTGAAIAAAGLVGLSISGASMNPARSLGTAIVAWRWTDQWLYAAGPLVGALAAVVLTALLHGPPDLDEHHAAEGDQHR